MKEYEDDFDFEEDDFSEIPTHTKSAPAPVKEAVAVKDPKIPEPVAEEEKPLKKPQTVQKKQPSAAKKTTVERKPPAAKKKTSRNSKQLGILIAGLVIACGISGVIGCALAGGFSNALSRDTQIAEENAVTDVIQEDTNTTAAVDPAAAAAQDPNHVPGAIPDVTELQDVIDIIAVSRNYGMTKRCYLTFDDGPSEKVTPQILDILAKYNVKATFFDVGKRIEMHPELAKREFDEGHLIANHSYSHDYDQIYATEDSIRNEIISCQEQIERATGSPVTFKLFRFPGGSYNAGDHAAEKQVYKETLKGMGYYYCDWNTLNGDAEGAEKDKTGLVQFFLDNSAEFISQGKNMVVLMHDTDAKQATVDALELIIQYVSEQGYTFHRLDEITL